MGVIGWLESNSQPPAGSGPNWVEKFEVWRIEPSQHSVGQLMPLGGGGYHNRAEFATPSPATLEEGIFMLLTCTSITI